jgi:bla regulator protein blaR1
MTETLMATLARAVGLALVQFVWQGAAIGLAAAAALALLRRAAPPARYVVACVGLLAMTMTPVGTTVALATQPSSTIASPETRPRAGTVAGVQVATVAATAREAGAWQRRVEPILPLITLGWGLVVLALTARLLRGWVIVERLRKQSVGDVGGALPEAARRIARRMGIRRRVRIGTSARVDVPTVIGWLRPAILVPASALAQLTPSQLEAILAHELAHIRRHDYLVNALQHGVETLFFYHPAVWWLSRRVRIERELCCDDLAVAVCGNPIGYAHALATLEEARHAVTAFGLAATGGALLPRIRRLLGDGEHERQQPPLALALGIGVFVLLTLAYGRVAASDAPARPVAQDTAPQPKSEQVILGLEEELRLAQVRGDAATVARLLNDHFVGTNQDGSVVDRDQAIAAVPRTQTPLALGLSTVTFTNDTAVVTGTQIDGITGRMRFTRVWALDEGRWTLISNSQFRDPRPAAAPQVSESVTVTNTVTNTSGLAAPPPPPPPPPPSNGLSPGAIRNLSGAMVVSPRKIVDVPPVYPEIARLANVKGLVVLSATIDADGNVVNPKILRSVPMLDQAALDAVLQWKYLPARVDGVSTPVTLTMTVTFSPVPQR